MRSILAGLRQLVLPWGASVGTARLVLGPDLPAALAAYRFQGVARYVSAIIFYNGSVNDDSYLFVAEVPQQTSAPGGYELHFGAVLNGVVQEVSVGNPQGWQLGLDYGGFTYTRLQTLLTEADLSAWTPINAVLPGTTAGQESWHTLPLAAGWTGAAGDTLQYRLVASPPSTVQMHGNLVAGTKADATTIGTLPVDYRPNVASDIIANAFGGALGGAQIPHVNIRTDGQIQIFGIGTSTNMNISGDYPLIV